MLMRGSMDVTVRVSMNLRLRLELELWLGLRLGYHIRIYHVSTKASVNTGLRAFNHNRADSIPVKWLWTFNNGVVARYKQKVERTKLLNKLGMFSVNRLTEKISLNRFSN